MNMRVIATGGTFDKTYDPLSGTLIFSESCVPELLTQARLANDICFEALFALDSLDANIHHIGFGVEIDVPDVLKYQLA